MKYLDELIGAMQSGRWVYGINDEMGRLLAATEDACHRLNSLLPSQKAERREILRGMLGRVGERFLIHSPFRCDFGSHIFIGEDLVANYNLTILDEEKVCIGNRVFIGPNVSIYTIIHALDPVQRSQGVMRAEEVVIEDDVWICGGVTILPGVTIGRGAVIGAGSVVTRSVPPMTLAAGNSCKPIRNITEDDRVNPELIFGDYEADKGIS